MTDLETQGEITRIVTGAVAASEAPDAAELPMVVWLRGDEEHCGEFTLEADDVMRQLGIRRSRLTQISGRELRVGRIRRGRYVSPVFRQADVDAYLGWTRATASHTKSSAILNEATQALLRQGDALSDTLQSVPDELATVVSDLTRQASFETIKAVHERSESLSHELQQLVGEWHALALRLSDAEKAQAARLVGHEEQLAAQRLLQERALKDLSELAALARLARSDQAEFASSVTEHLAALSASLEAVAAEVSKPRPATPAAPLPRGLRADARRIKRLAGRQQTQPFAAKPVRRRPQSRK